MKFATAIRFETGSSRESLQSAFGRVGGVLTAGFTMSTRAVVGSSQCHGRRMLKRQATLAGCPGSPST